MILDYAENMERHFTRGDILEPDLFVRTHKTGEKFIDEQCPACDAPNVFKARLNEDDFQIDKNGYFSDLAGKPIMNEHGQPIPAHFGRRCNGMSLNSTSHVFDRCAYRWSFKECPGCKHENDIAARICEACGDELIDPNEKLRLHVEAIRNDPYSLSTDKVLRWEYKKHVSQAGNDTLMVTYTTEFRSFTVWYLPKNKQLWSDLSVAVFGRVCPDVETFVQYAHCGKIPKTVTVKRERSSRFFSIYGHNKEETKWKNETKS